MKYFYLIALTLLSFPSFGHALKCKILRNDGVTLYGECLKLKESAIYRSCLDYTCKVDRELTRPLEKGEEGCIQKETSEKDFKAIIEDEHKTLDPDKIPYCRYGTKEKGD